MLEHTHVARNPYILARQICAQVASTWGMMPSTCGGKLEHMLSPAHVHAGTPKAHMSPSIEATDGGRVLRTNTQWGLMQLAIDPDARVHSVLYLGRPPDEAEMPSSRIASLVGLHTSYLNNLVRGLGVAGIHPRGV